MNKNMSQRLKQSCIKHYYLLILTHTAETWMTKTKDQNTMQAHQIGFLRNRAGLKKRDK